MPRPHQEIAARFTFAYKGINGNLFGPFKIKIDNLTLLKDKMTAKPDALFVLIHRWTGNEGQVGIQSVTQDLLLCSKFSQPAAILVDWQRSAMVMYKQSAFETVVIGNEVGLLIFELVKDNLVDAKDVHLIGIDMGSHVAAIAASTSSKLAY